MTRLHTLPSTILLALVAACTGRIVDGEPDPIAGAPAPADSPAPPAPAPPAPGATPAGPPPAASGNQLSAQELTCAGTSGATPARLRRLTQAQYRASLTAAGVPGTVQSPFTYVSPSDRFSTYAATYTMTGDELLAALDAAETAASALVARLHGDGSCLGKAQPADLAACARTLVAQKGEILFRRPLTSTEVDEYGGLAGGGSDAELALSFASLLVSPYFLYRVELGDGAADPRGRRRLSTYEAAAAMSYTLTDAPPDAMLLAAARDGRLASDDEVKAQVLRLIGDTRAGTPRFMDFLRELTQWDRLGPKDTRLIYKFNSLGGWEYPAMDARITMKAWLADAGRRDFLGTLLASNHFVARGHTLQYWDLPVPDDQKGHDNDLPITLPPDRRAGFLSMPFFLINHATFTRETQPVQRGRFVRETLLCKPVPELPIGAVPPLGDLGPNATMRERLAAHTTNAACNACHQLMDPIGLAFEGFDDFGMTRASDHGKPVDGSGALVGSDSDGPVAGAAQLGARLASSGEVERCFVRQNFRYLLGREEVAADACAIEKARAAFHASGGDYVTLFAALLTSDSHLYRVQPGGR
jgi:hypothetical protein